jgi:hypothetical protein
VARETTATDAARLNPHVRVQWLDARHDMIQTHPRALAEAVFQLAGEDDVVDS